MVVHGHVNSHCLYITLKYTRIGICHETLFTVLHAMQTRSSDENSVCLSVTRVHCDKTVESSVQIFLPYERSFSLVY